MSTEIISEEAPMKGIKLRLYPNQSQIIELKQMFGNLDCSFDESQVKAWQRKFNKRKHQASVQVN